MISDIDLAMEREIAPLSPAWRAAQPIVSRRAVKVDEMVQAFVAVLSANSVSLRAAGDLVTREYLRRALVVCRGNQCAAALSLGIHRNTVSRIAAGDRGGRVKPTRGAAKRLMRDEP